MRYTRELLAPLVKRNVSVAGVLRDLGKNQVGGIHTHLSKRIRDFGLDTSHFTGQASNAGARHKGGPGKTPWRKVLTRQPDRDRREDAFRLRRALIESGRVYKCEGCGRLPRWRGKTLRLHVEHKNGDWRDNRPSNLMFLCPNCHSQTPTFGNNKGGTGVTSRAAWFRHIRKQKREGIRPDEERRC